MHGRGGLVLSLYNNLSNINNADTLSVVLFILYKLGDSDEYGTFSKLSYILDRKEVLDMCEVFGGMTIKVPTLQELQKITQGLLLYTNVVINKQPMKKAIEEMDLTKNEQDQTIGVYEQICEVLKDYSFGKQL